jgi:NTP pyrophosphatase (non-canonical NTP hydrolase)
MTLEEYQEMAMRTVNPRLNQVENLDNAVLGIAGEAGEVAETWKKFKFHGARLDQTNLKLLDEAGDVLWYLALLAHSRGVSLGDIAAGNIEKLSTRWPEGFKEGKE